MYSPVLQRHIAIARVRPELAKPGTKVNLEFTINHRYEQVGAHVARLPLYNPTDGPREDAREARREDEETAAPDDGRREGRPHLRRHRHRWRPQRPRQRRLPRQVGPATLILERRHLVGGAAITEELHPGFWFTTFSYALSLLRPDIIQDLELTKHGFMPLLMPSTFCPDGERRLPG
jgi:hypothetical protein